jgi:HPt (histidine-containing phosphotransfer) domain-containing protein
MSGDKSSAREISPRAFEIFVSELSLQLSDATKCITQLGCADYSGCAEIKMAFHRIKGGAGFFDEDVLASLASLCEQYFDEDEQEISGEELGELNDLVKQMKQISFRLQQELQSE